MAATPTLDTSFCCLKYLPETLLLSEILRSYGAAVRGAAASRGDLLNGVIYGRETWTATTRRRNGRKRCRDRRRTKTRSN